MNLEIKKELASNWFKMLQESICESINKLEKKNAKFKSTNWKRNLKKDEGDDGPTVESYTIDEAPLVSTRKKDWPKGSIDTDDKKMKLAKDLINLDLNSVRCPVIVF